VSGRADSIETIVRWLAEGRRVVACTLVETVGSAPLELGAQMLVDDRGTIEGSVTGGCVEAALAEEAMAVLDGAPPRVISYGVSDEQAVDVGLTCGGTVRVFVSEVVDSDPFSLLASDLAAGRPVALATMLDGPTAGSRMVVRPNDAIGTLGHTSLLDANVAREARGCLDQGRSVLRQYGADGETIGSELGVAIHALAAPPRMVIVGASDFSAALAKMATEIGYHVTIVDARPAFAQSSRFSAHADVVVSWPQDYLRGQELGSRDALLVFSHDPKFDEAALLCALDSDAGYIGALGSRRTAADREKRLADAGVDDAGLKRIHAPCGLDLGARTPGETAIAVLAEILAVRTGRSGGRLRDGEGPIRARDHSSA
jgi:xanthine dehydrogenase accessory factor